MACVEDMVYAIRGLNTWACCNAGLHTQQPRPQGAFPWPWRWGGKRTFSCGRAKTIQKWNVWRRVIFLKVDLWMGHSFRRTLTPNTSPENPPPTLPREWYHPGVASRSPLTSAFLRIELSCLRAVYVSTLKGIYSLKRIKWNALTVKMVSLRKTRSWHWNVQNVAQHFACHPLQRLKTTTNRPLTSVSKKF